MDIIEVYEMNDGTIYKKETEAKNHVTDKLSEILEKHLVSIDLNSKNSNFWKRSQIIEIVEHLMGDYDKASQLIKELNLAIE